jgi:hypothetical protein
VSTFAKEVSSLTRAAQLISVRLKRLKYYMYRTLPFVLLLMFATDSRAVAAQSAPEFAVHILSKETCVVTNERVPCSSVGEKLRSLGISQSTLITYSVQHGVSIEDFRNALETVIRSGYEKAKVSFITEQE